MNEKPNPQLLFSRRWQDQLVASVLLAVQKLHERIREEQEERQADNLRTTCDA